MPVEFATREIAAKYNRFAHRYDFIEAVFRSCLGWGSCGNQFFLKPRAKFSKSLSERGRIFSIITPIARSLRGCQHRNAENSARAPGELNVKVRFALADAEPCRFPTAPSTPLLSLAPARFPIPRMPFERWPGLASRLVKFSYWSTVGVIAHGWAAGRPDADRFAKPCGCHWNREPLELAKTAGLKIISTRRSIFGVFHRIAAVRAAYNG